MSPKEDSEENLNMKEIEKEKDYYMQFEINPDFRRFVRKLSRCRSIASLDVSNVISGDEGVTNNNEPIKTPEKIEDEKGKKGERINKADDSIQIKDYKQNNAQQRSQRERKMGTWMNTDFTEDRNYDNIRRASQSPMSYSSQSLPRKEKRASVILREKHQSMMMIDEGNEPTRPSNATFSLPRVSCFHRSTRV